MSKINFNEVPSAANAEFVRPGVYEFRVKSASFEKPEGKKKDGTDKSTFVRVVFENVSNGATFNESFYITPGALPRLQYLHEAWFDKKLDKSFENYEQVGAYFEKVFNAEGSKKFQRFMLIGGEEQSDGRVYAKIGYAGFVIPESKSPVAQTFEPGSAEYIMNVKKNADAPILANNDNSMLPSSVTPSSNSEDDLPF